MATRLKILLVMAALFAVGAFLSGCGSVDDDSAIDATSSTQDPAVDESAPSGAEAPATAPPTAQEADAATTATVDVATTATVQVDEAAESTAAELSPAPIADAEMPAPEAPAEVVGPDPGATDAAASHSYSEVIEPILETSCMSCHAPGAPGAIHMTLDDASDAASVAHVLARVTGDSSMPPWPASDLSPAFVGDFSLDDEQRAAIAEWAADGAPLDVAPSTPLGPALPPAFLEDPDLVVTSAGGPYQGSPARVDDYRCMIFDPKVTKQEWILASHFEPDQTAVAHHAIVKLASADLREQAEKLDAAEEGVGWTCYSGTGLKTHDGGYEFSIAGWAPGGPPARQPEGYGIPVNPGEFLVVQMHYHYDAPAPPDNSRMVFDLADEADLAEVGGGFKTLTGQLYLGPAEIPCYEGDPNPLCDRDAALERVRNLYGDRSAGLPGYFLRQCGATPADFEQMTDGTAWSTCDLPVRNPGRITSVTGHMHELGLSVRLTLNPDTPEERILLDIPDWDFEWQLGYRPVEDIIIDRDDTIRVDCAWNRERAPYEADGWILWADGTGDEMCYTNITTAPLD